MIHVTKPFYLSCFFLGITIIALGQPYKKGTLSLSLGAEVLAPEKKLSETHYTGWGATTKGEYVFGRHATATVVTGYYFMRSKNRLNLTEENIVAVPLKTGLRYYLGNFYGSGEAGVIFLTDYFRGTTFVYSLGMGDKFKIASRVIDISLRHEAWVLNERSRGIIALRVGYEFAVNQKSVVSSPSY